MGALVAVGAAVGRGVEVGGMVTVGVDVGVAVANGRSVGVGVDTGVTELLAPGKDTGPLVGVGVGEVGIAIAMVVAVAGATDDGSEVGVGESVEFVVRGTVVVTADKVGGVRVRTPPSWPQASRNKVATAMSRKPGDI